MRRKNQRVSGKVGAGEKPIVLMEHEKGKRLFPVHALDRRAGLLFPLQTLALPAQRESRSSVKNNRSLIGITVKQSFISLSPSFSFSVWLPIIL